jgi:hypothetical protein
LLGFSNKVAESISTYGVNYTVDFPWGIAENLTNENTDVSSISKYVLDFSRLDYPELSRFKATFLSEKNEYYGGEVYRYYVDTYLDSAQGDRINSSAIVYSGTNQLQHGPLSFAIAKKDGKTLMQASVADYSPNKLNYLLAHQSFFFDLIGRPLTK